MSIKIQSINPKNIHRLELAFSDFLISNDVPFDEIGVREKDDKLLVIFVTGERAQIIEMEKEGCIGSEPEVIAEDVITPILDQMKSKNV